MLAWRCSNFLVKANHLHIVSFRVRCVEKTPLCLLLRIQYPLDLLAAVRQMQRGYPIVGTRRRRIYALCKLPESADCDWPEVGLARSIAYEPGLHYF